MKSKDFFGEEVSANCNEIEWKADVWFPRKLILLSCYFKELWSHVICVWSAESVNSWVDEDDCEGRLKPIIMMYLWYC